MAIVSANAPVVTTASRATANLEAPAPQATVVNRLMTLTFAAG
jgi:hypothetical protein